MPSFYCMKCQMTTENGSACANEHCGQRAGAVIDKDMSKRPAFELGSPIVFSTPVEATESDSKASVGVECCGGARAGSEGCCGGPQCSGGHSVGETIECLPGDCPDATPALPKGHDFAEAGGTIQVKMLAERDENGNLVVRQADTATSTWIEDDMMFEYPDAFLLTLTLDADKILAAIPETKVIAVDMR